MNTVYLDKNVYSYLSKSSSEPVYRKMLMILKGSTNFLTSFSLAHIEDMMQSSNEQENIKDLEFIESISGNNYCYYDNNNNKFCYNYFTPKEIYGCQDNIYPLIDAFFELSDIDQFITDDLKKSIENLKIDWANADVQNSIDPASKELIGRIYPLNLSELTTSDILREAYRGLKAFNQDNSIYRTFRANNINNFNKGKLTIDALTYDLSKDLKETVLGKGFMELVYETLQQQGNKPIYRFEAHTAAYIFLDMFGYNADSKVRVNNLFVDSKHSYYGAYFDYVVSNDYGFVVKSRALYKMLGINTRVLFPQEFITEVDRINEHSQTTKDEFLDNIIFLSEHSSVINSFSDPNYLDQLITQYDCNETFLYYFDTLVKVSNSMYSDFYLTKSKNVYLGDLIFTKVVEQLVNDCLVLFGVDQEALGALNIEQEVPLLNGNEEYILRIWRLDNDGVIILKMSNKQLYLQIVKR